MIRSIVALSILLATAASAEFEARCSEVEAGGGTCNCAESLDSATATIQDPGSSCGSFYCINPDNSTGTDYVCRSTSGWFLSQNLNGGAGDPVDYWTFDTPAADMPAQSTVSYVWEFAEINNEATGGRGRIDKVDSSVRRLCMRQYQQFSTDFSSWADCNNKIFEFQWGSSTLQSSTSHNSGAGGIIGEWCGGFSSCNDVNFVPTGDVIVPASCQFGDEWCRIEACVSGEVLAGTGLTFDYYVDTTTSGLHAEQTDQTLGNASGGSLNVIYPMMLYRQPTSGSCNGTRRWSHIMMATWDTDDGQVIGPAYEIEGGAPPPPALRAGSVSRGSLK